MRVWGGGGRGVLLALCFVPILSLLFCCYCWRCSLWISWLPFSLLVSVYLFLFGYFCLFRFSFFPFSVGFLSPSSLRPLYFTLLFSFTFFSLPSFNYFLIFSPSVILYSSVSFFPSYLSSTLFLFSLFIYFLLFSFFLSLPYSVWSLFSLFLFIRFYFLFCPEASRASGFVSWCCVWFYLICSVHLRKRFSSG